LSILLPSLDRRWNDCRMSGDLQRPADRPVRVCVVCAGNICRSPMAEAVLRAKLDAAGLGHRVVVDSAGTGNWHVGSPAHARSTAALRRRGYRLDHSARQFLPSWFSERDLVLALDVDNLDDLTRMAPRDLPAGRLRMLRVDWSAEHGDDGGVPDPYGLDDGAYDHALDLIEAACDALVLDLVAELEPDPTLPPARS
jgi:protein-tyrosine phosphatase